MFSSDGIARDTTVRQACASIALAVLLGALAVSPSGAAAENSAPRPSHLAAAERVVAPGRAPAILAQEFPSPPLYQLLPHDYPYPLIRICYTYVGICLIPFTIQPGTPCECVASNGARVSGVCTK
jgi:hypothetical protein